MPEIGSEPSVGSEQGHLITCECPACIDCWSEPDNESRIGFHLLPLDEWKGNKHLLGFYRFGKMTTQNIWPQYSYRGWGFNFLFFGFHVYYKR